MEMEQNKAVPLMGEQMLEQIDPDSREFIVLKSYYKAAIRTVESKLSIMNEEHYLNHGRKPIQMISSRIKTQQSAIEKMKRHGYPLTVEAAVTRLNDLAGVRAICAFEQDAYDLAEELLRHADITLLHKKDYIASPKASGYRSLHLIVSVPIFLAAGKRDVKVEVQLRTISMDFWANIEHELRYKQQIEFTRELNQQILECAELSARLDEQMGALHQNLSRYIAAQTEGK